jgi:hypothetical protein
MDRAWMYDLARIDPVYIENVRHFVEEAMRHANREKNSDIFCPCVDCDNKIAWSDSKVVKSHLIKRGFKKSHTIWIAHGEIDNALLVFEMVKNIKVVFGKGTVKGQKRKKTPTLIDIPFKKQSIFLSTFLTGRTFKLVTSLI